LAEAPASFGPALSAETPASTGTLALAPAPERRVWSPLDRFDDPGAKPVAAACPREVAAGCPPEVRLGPLTVGLPSPRGDVCIAVAACPSRSRPRASGT